MSEIQEEKSDLCRVEGCLNKKAVIKYNNGLCDAGECYINHHDDDGHCDDGHCDDSHCDDAEYTVNYCENHICAVRFCERNRISDSVHTCEYHTCEDCGATLECSLDNGLLMCRRCFNEQNKSFLKKFLIVCGVIVAVSIGRIYF